MSNKVKIFKYDNFGRGISKLNEKIVFVDKAKINEEVNISIKKENKNFLEASNIDYINNTKCPYYNECGGCTIRHMSYQEQLDFKYNKVKELVERNLGNVKVNNILKTNEDEYRNKIILRIKDNKLGLFKEKSNDIINIDKCLLVNEKINEIIKDLNNFLSKYRVDDNEVLIRTGIENLIYFKEDITKDIINYIDIENIIIKDKVIKGKDYIVKNIFDLNFNLSYKSFYQVNDLGLIVLYNEIKNIFKEKKYKNVLDLYSGVGTITLVISKYVENITGIEIIKDAVINANVNKELNNIKNANFLCDKVENIIGEFKDIDAIIVDPPRKGLDKKTLNSIISKNVETVIYVSCNINTLVRDLKELQEIYNIKTITPVDMFPNTYHVETVVLLNKVHN